MNRVFVVGNLTGDIYFDRFLIQSRRRSFLRLILMAERPRPVRGLRVVLWDEKAELYFPYLKKGSELAVIGQFQSRQHKGKLVHEVVSESLLLLRNVNWEGGEQARQKHNLPALDGTNNHVFLVGRVMDELSLTWPQRSPESGGGEYAQLRLRMLCDEYLQGLRVVVRGALAELAYPYLQTGSKIAVDGHLQSRDHANGKQAVEVTAHNMTFLENINWAAGDAANNPARSLSDPLALELPEDATLSTGD